MSHVVIIIQRNASLHSAERAESECIYHYQIPVPHDATPADVADLVRKAYRRLEGADPNDH